MRGKKLLLLARKVGSWLSNSANGLLWDSFLSGGAATNRLATPGPGRSAITDTESKFSVSGGDLVCSGGKAAPAFGDPGIWLGYDNAGTPAALAMAAGYAYFVDVTAGGSGNATEFGFDGAATGQTNYPRQRIWTSNEWDYTDGSITVSQGVNSAAAGTRIKALTVQRSSTHGFYKGWSAFVG